MIRLAVRVQAAQAELALAELLELAPNGVEEVELADGIVEYAVYGAPGELPELPDLQAAVGARLVEISSSRVPEDWQERWRRFHRPVQIVSPAPRRAPDLWVRPSWETPRGALASAAPDGGATAEIVIDPGQAFGTGGHATTRLCLELLLRLAASEPARGPLVDVGTGSGVLAIAAAKLGYAPVLALDNDPRSVEAATQNARANQTGVQVRRLDIRADPLLLTGSDRSSAGPQGFAATVLTANLLRPLLLDLARRMPHPPGHLLAGGLLAEEVDEVVGAFVQRLGLHERERREQGEWAAVWMQSAHAAPAGRTGSASSVAARTIAR